MGEGLFMYLYENTSVHIIHSRVVLRANMPFINIVA